MKKSIDDYLTKREISILRKFCEFQLELLDSDSIEEGDVVMHFEYKGCFIANPFVDESGSYEVDPVEYYGDYFLKSLFMNIFSYDN